MAIENPFVFGKINRPDRLRRLAEVPEEAALSMATSAERHVRDREVQVFCRIGIY